MEGFGRRTDLVVERTEVERTTVDSAEARGRILTCSCAIHLAVEGR